MLTDHRDVRSIVEEFLFHSPFKEKGCSFVVFQGVCTVVGSLGREEQQSV